MTIRSVTVVNVRNHERSELECAQHVNILSGRNGSGKTTVLEAMCLGALARSFVPVNDASLIRRGEEAASVTVHAQRDIDVPYFVTVRLREGSRKRIESSLGSNLTPRDIVGELPVVTLSPDHKSITFGAPSERRAFLDAVMAQASRRTTDLLFELRRILKQRNAMLDAVDVDETQLTLWTEAFITVSAELASRRARFLKTLLPLIQQSYEQVSGKAEEIDVVYEPDGLENVDVATETVDSIAAALRETASRLAFRERQRRSTLFGAQRDELSLRIDGGIVKESASQGQHKSFLVALKLAECTILHDVRGERPVVLLDDVFSELDRSRCERTMELVLAMGMQCFVTTTEGDTIASMVPAGTDARRIILERGHIVDMREAA